MKKPAEKRAPSPLTWEQAREQQHPRLCHVPIWMRGGSACCELCAEQHMERSETGRLMLACTKFNIDKPHFRPREG